MIKDKLISKLKYKIGSATLVKSRMDGLNYISKKINLLNMN
jgi:hypothetical protein